MRACRVVALLILAKTSITPPFLLAGTLAISLYFRLVFAISHFSIIARLRETLSSYTYFSTDAQPIVILLYI